MEPVAWVTASVMVAALLAQAALPAYRLLVVLAGATLCAVATTLAGVSGAADLMAGVPWDVLVLLVALGLVSDVVGDSRVFGVLALRATRWSGARPAPIFMVFALGMFAVSGLVNNLTALMLVLPVVLILLQLMGVTQRYASWLLGTLIVACNLGGAATPIGDFPAVLLLGRGSMSFATYLREALGPALLAMVLVLLAAATARPWRRVGEHPASPSVTLAVMGGLFRHARVSRRHLVPALVSLAAMLCAWALLPASLGVSPGLVAMVGALAVLGVSPRDGERRLRTRVDMEAVLFLLALFVMVNAVRSTGLFTEVATQLARIPDPALRRVFLVVLATLLTGVFSAGPTMAALLEVAEPLAALGSAEATYVGLAFGVCAGSSLFLTAATSGPLAQALAERARLSDPEGRPVVFGFRQHLAPGLSGAAITLAVGVLYAALR